MVKDFPYNRFSTCEILILIRSVIEILDEVPMEKIARSRGDSAMFFLISAINFKLLIGSIAKSDLLTSQLIVVMIYLDILISLMKYKVYCSDEINIL
jgi:hypothetical protein